MLHLLAWALGFLGRRLVGHGNSDLGNTLTRIFCWGIPCALVVYFVTHVWWFAWLSMPLAWLGIAPGYWGGQFALAIKKNRTWDNYATLAIRGAFIMQPICMASYVLTIFGYLDHGIAFWGVVAGLNFPAYYLIGIPLAKNVKLPLLTSYPEWGEGLLGGTVLLGATFPTIIF